MDVTLELDVRDPQEGPWELEGLGALGAVMVEVVDQAGPTGHPLCRVTGSEPALLAWLVLEYEGLGELLPTFAEAVALLKP